MDHSHHYQDFSYAPSEQWVDRSAYHPQQHHSPMEEYPQYGFASSPPVQHGFPTHPQRPALQPIVTTPWPSVLANQQQQQQQPIYNPPPPAVHAIPQPPQPPPAPPPLQTSPASATPQLGSSHVGQATSTPRRTLTDSDRRKMCQYHEEHPTKKQTEIGEIFGVERSTVSKVLRQKEKYLRQEEGSRSPVKASKKNKPDLERALTRWAQNQLQKGTRASDDAIKQQAHLFWRAAGNTGDLPGNIDSPSWMEKFKQKNNLTGAGLKARRSPLVGDDGNFSPISPDTGDVPPFSPDDQLSRTVSPTSATEMQQPPILRRQPSSNYDGLGIRSAAAAAAAGVRAPLHSQSNTSLSSAFTEGTGATAFSSENTSVGSPVISPDIVSSSSSYFPTSPQPLATPTSSMQPILPSQQHQHPTNVADNSIRPRSQTFPQISPADSYISPPQSANTSSPVHTSTAAVFDSPTVTTMPPPPAPLVQGKRSPHGHSPLSPPGLSKTKSTPHLSMTPRHVSAAPSLTDAKKGLEAAVAYLKGQGKGNDSPDVAAIRSVMMKMTMSKDTNTQQLPGGLHRIPEMEFVREMGSGEHEDMFMTGMTNDNVDM